MKNIDEVYKDWCGEHHTTNSGYPVHDSAEAQDFAEYYHKEMLANEGQKPDSNCNIQHVSGSAVMPEGFKVYKCTDCGAVNVKKDNGNVRVGFCDECEHPLWN
jgi:rubrerythrin